MSSENIRNKLINTFKSVLKVGEETAVEDLVIGEHSKWDSLAQVVLLSALENEFNISIDFNDSADLTSFKTILDYIIQNDNF